MVRAGTRSVVGCLPYAAGAAVESDCRQDCWRAHRNVRARDWSAFATCKLGNTLLALASLIVAGKELSLFSILLRCHLAFGLFAVAPTLLLAPLQAQDNNAEATVGGVSVYDSVDLLEKASGAAKQAGGDIANAIERIYRTDGYFLAEAVTTNDPQTGRPIIIVTEGTLGSITLTGGSDKTRMMVKGYLSRLQDGRALQIDRFERQLALASDQSNLQVSTAFIPALESANMDLSVSITEKPRSYLAMIDTVALADGNAIRLVGQFTEHGLAIGGDKLQLTGFAAREPSDDLSVAGTVSYRAPIDTRGTYLEVSAGNSIARRRFDQIDLTSRQRGAQIGVVLGHAIVRKIGVYAFVLGDYEYLNAKSRLGAQRNGNAVHVIRGRLLYGSHVGNGGLFEASATLAAGIEERGPSLIATKNRDFYFLGGRVGLATQIASKVTLRAEAAGQLALSEIPDVERFFLGHQPDLRGYAQSEAEGESGISATAELQYEAFNKKGFAASPFLFVDGGLVRTRRSTIRPTPDEDLASVGAGTEISFSKGLSLRGWLATPLKDTTFSRAGQLRFYIRLVKGW
jgi:hemolysin activation/secretion protein